VSVTSRIDTGNPPFAWLCKCTLNLDSVQCQCRIQKLQVIQNNAARLISGTLHKYDHITSYLSLLHWLPIRQRIEYKILIIVFKCLHNMAPAYLTELIQPYQPKRQNRSSSKGILLRIPRTTLATGGDRMFAHIGPALWNSLPFGIRESQTLAQYSRQLKTHLYRKAYL